MEIRNLITFTKVAEAQSLSQAARLLGYAQSTVTMQMQQLEQELGVPLYERVGKKIRITQAGQELLTYAIPIIRMSQEASQIGKSATPKVDGFLRLGVLDVLVDDSLADMVSEYRLAYPQVELQIITQSDTEKLIDSLKHNQLDLLMTVDLPISDQDLIHGNEDEPDPLHYFVSTTHPLRNKKKITTADIAPYPVVGRDITKNPDLALRIAAREQSGSKMSQSQSDKGRSRKGQEQQDGSRQPIAVAPASMAASYVSSGQLIPLNLTPEGGDTYRQTLYHKNKWITEAMNAWIKMTEDRR